MKLLKTINKKKPRAKSKWFYLIRLFLLKTVLGDINLEPVNSETMVVENRNTPTKKDNPKKSVRSERSSQTEDEN